MYTGVTDANAMRLRGDDWDKQGKCTNDSSSSGDLRVDKITPATNRHK